jgi:hypothetical protein
MREPRDNAFIGALRLDRFLVHLGRNLGVLRRVWELEEVRPGSSGLCALQPPLQN